MRERVATKDTVIGLRLDGLTFAQIGERLGVSASTAHRIYSREPAVLRDDGEPLEPPRPAVVYVYRMVVVRPDGSDEPGWEPQRWHELCEDRGWVAANEDGDTTFRWPQRKLFLSGGAASRRAKMLREYGATVTVERSAPVEWEPTSVAEAAGL